jgi:RNA polymerase sigma factor (sigma-70 family)
VVIAMHSLAAADHARILQADRLAAAARRRPPVDGSDLERLVTMAAAGEQPAWDALVERFGPLLIRVARSHGLTPHEAEDAVQETWMCLMRHIGAVRQPRALGGWLRTTVRNESLRLRVRLERERPSGQDLGDALADTMSHETPDESDAVRCRVAVARALDVLPARHRTLMRALFAEPEPTYRDVATKLGMPIGSIGPTRGRCIAQLRRDARLRALAEAAD